MDEYIISLSLGPSRSARLSYYSLFTRPLNRQLSHEIDDEIHITLEASAVKLSFLDGNRQLYLHN